MIEGRCLAGIDLEKIDIDRVSFRDAKLPASSFDNCVSHKLSWGRKSRQKFHRPAGLANGKLRRQHVKWSPLPSLGRGEEVRLELRSCFTTRANEISVKSFITLRGRVPRKIPCHRSFHQPRREAPVAEDLPRTFDRVPESFARIFVTEKAVTAVGCRIVIFDDFLNSTGHPRNREGTILQVVHRAQTGWLETRWNQADVHASLDQMCQSLVVVFLVGKSCWKFPGCDR